MKASRFFHTINELLTQAVLQRRMTTAFEQLTEPSERKAIGDFVMGQKIDPDSPLFTSRFDTLCEFIAADPELVTACVKAKRDQTKLPDAVKLVANKLNPPALDASAQENAGVLEERSAPSDSTVGQIETKAADVPSTVITADAKHVGEGLEVPPQLRRAGRRKAASPASQAPAHENALGYEELQAISDFVIGEKTKPDSLVSNSSVGALFDFIAADATLVEACVAARNDEKKLPKALSLVLGKIAYPEVHALAGDLFTERLLAKVSPEHGRPA